jgi:hypothetical protein
LGGNGKLRPRDLVYGRFVAHERDHHLDNNQLGLGPRSGPQMFEYGEAILVCPVVEHSAKEEDRDALQVIFSMPCRLRVKEVLSFQEPKSCQPKLGRERI